MRELLIFADTAIFLGGVRIFCAPEDVPARPRMGRIIYRGSPFNDLNLQSGSDKTMIRFVSLQHLISRDQHLLVGNSTLLEKTDTP